jgi:hypothetical protein
MEVADDLAEHVAQHPAVLLGARGGVEIGDERKCAGTLSATVRKLTFPNPVSRFAIQHDVASWSRFGIFGAAELAALLRKG